MSRGMSNKDRGRDLRVLVFNCGSSTLKFELMDVGGDGASLAATRIADGLVDKVGAKGASIELRVRDGEQVSHGVTAAGYAEAARLALDALQTAGLGDIAGCGAQGSAWRQSLCDARTHR